MASTTVRKQRLFISANSWWLFALLKLVFFCGGSVVLRHYWELVHQCRKECHSTMLTFENFSALLNMFLFSDGNVVLRRCLWLVQQCRKNVIQQCQFLMVFGHCLFFFPSSRLYLALVVVGTTVPKQRLFINANFWWLLAQLKVVFFWRQWCTSALLMASTTLPIQKLFISANFWWLLALLKILLFFGGNVVLWHCWALVQQRRKECC